MDEKKILITGATGFLGFRTTERLALEDDISSIKAAGRKKKKSMSVSSNKVEYLLGDLTDLNYVESLFQEKVTHIIHCAALSSPWGKYNDFYQSNVIATQNLLKKAKENRIRRIVFISTPSIYFNYRNRWNIKETDPLPTKFVNHYASTKREAELLLEKSGLEFINLRPRAIVGRGDTVIMPRLINAMKRGRLRIMGDGNNMVDLTSVSNVVEAIRLSLGASSDAVCQNYNITNGAPVALWDTVKFAFKELGMDFPNKRIPLIIVKNLALFMELYARIYNTKEPTLTRYTVGAMALNFTMNIEKARKCLAYQPLVSTKESIIEFTEWYKEQHNVEA